MEGHRTRTGRSEEVPVQAQPVEWLSPFRWLQTSWVMKHDSEATAWHWDGATHRTGSGSFFAFPARLTRTSVQRRMA